jgi:peptidoglycan/xylan/chitin deacetylase (PgdA/CDA1 family)
MSNFCTVFTYHRVLKAREKSLLSSSHHQRGLVVKDNIFKWQIRMIARFYHTINLETFLYHLENAIEFPPRACLVVFDDGYWDFANIALPILNQSLTPAALFITQRQSGATPQLSPMDKWYLVIETWWSQVSRNRTNRNLYFDLMYGKARESTLFAQPQEQVRIIDELCQKLHVNIPFDEFGNNLYLNSEKISALTSKGVIIGSHGYDHHILTSLPREVITQHLEETYRWLSRFTPKDLITFAYPNGNYNHQLIQDLRNAGFKAAFTTARGICTHTTNKYELPRYSVKNNLSGILEIYLRSRI